MTTTQKPTKRETLSLFRQRGKFRNIVLELHSTWLTVRLKGTRQRLTVTYDQLYKLAAENAVAEARAARKAARRKES